MPPVFIRRREIWLPTAWGWLVLLALAAAAIVLAPRPIYGLLAMDAPVGARILVVEGWMDPEDFDQAIATYRAKRYDLVLTSGGPVRTWPEPMRRGTYAELAA